MAGRIKAILFGIIVAVIAMLISDHYQDEIIYNDGLGWDGVKYAKVAEDFSSGNLPETKAPFVNRIGVPFIVSQIFPGDIKSGFFYVNQFFGLLNIVLFTFLLFKFLSKRWVIYLLILLYVTQWHNYFRFGSFYPVQVDPAAITLILSGLLILVSDCKRSVEVILISLIVFFGTFIREILIIPAILLIVKHGNFNLADIKKFRFNKILPASPLIYIPLALFIVSTVIVAALVSPTNSHKFYNAAMDLLYSKSFFKYIHSWLIAYGPILLLLIPFWRISLRFIRKRKVLLMYLVIIIIFSYLGGMDTERLAYWGFPVVYIVIGKVLEKVKFDSADKFILFLLLGLQVIAQRLLWIVPNYPNQDCPDSFVALTPIGNCFPYLNLYAGYSDLKTAVIGFIQYGLLALFIYWYFKVKGEKQKGEE